jgi:putative SOS response-associated peptidase YedK
VNVWSQLPFNEGGRVFGQRSEGVLPNCTVVTTTPNDLMAPIHNQIPVILAPQAKEAWLAPKDRQATALLRPCASEGMEADPVGNPRNNGRELIRPTVDYE